MSSFASACALSKRFLASATGFRRASRLTLGRSALVAAVVFFALASAGFPACAASRDAVGRSALATACFLPAAGFPAFPFFLLMVPDSFSG